MSSARMMIFLHEAGVAAHPQFPLDGCSLHENLRDPAAVQPGTLFWRMKHLDQRAVRDGRWKYLAIGENEYLFDLEADARERVSQTRRERHRLDRMRSMYEDWQRTMPPIPGDAGAELVYTQKDMP